MNYFINKIYNDKQYKYRKDTDVFFENMYSKIILNGVEKKAVDFATNHQLLNKDLWETFVEQFKTQSDSEGERWRGEYFGKMMRGGTFIYKITRDQTLYNTLKDACLELISLQDEDGRISSYKREAEFFGWDIWCRKYVLLGLEYFIEISNDDILKEKLLNACIKHLDYIMSKVGSEKGKLEITNTSTAWGCVNSCTILEPVVKLYNLTNNEKYLEFAKYIVSTGGSNIGNLIELAIEDIKYPYEYPTTKAYEMMSFFEGAVELYSVTKEEYLKTAFLNFVNKIIETDYTIIGCGGCTHELFDHSSITQTEPQPDIVQETCVTVTMMKVFARALELTGESKYSDCIENSYYNAMLGTLNYNLNDELYWGKEYEFQFDYSPSKEFVKRIKGMTYDSYSPLLKDARCKKTGGYNLMAGNKCYGCCACIGSLGVATLPLYSVMVSESGIVLNHYMNMETKVYSPDGNIISIKMNSLYPYNNKIKINISLEKKEKFEVKLRIPKYCEYAIVNGVKVASGNYYSIIGEWYNNQIDIEFEYTYETILLNNKIAVRNGAIVYAIDNRNENIDSKVSNKIVNVKEISKDFDCNSSILVQFDNNKEIKMVDYSSSGSVWKEGTNKVTVWIDRQ